MANIRALEESIKQVSDSFDWTFEYERDYRFEHDDHVTPRTWVTGILLEMETDLLSMVGVFRIAYRLWTILLPQEIVIEQSPQPLAERYGLRL